jgi:alpha-L-rhamnosidase
MKKIVAIFSLLICLASSAQIKLENLRCEMLVNPQSIDVTKPRLSWEIVSSKRNVMQEAYQIIIASSKEKLSKNMGDIWNSGRVNSNASIHIKYAGKPLQSRMQCYWKVKTVTNQSDSSWSEPASFSIGLLKKEDWKAKWIGYDKSSLWDSVTQYSRLSSRYFRKPFQSQTTIKKATVYIVGLGLYELYINGNKIGDQVLAPAPTDYRKSVLYNTHDVTMQIKDGENVIATVLGNGRFFTMRQNYKPQKINTFGFPKMLLQLEIEYANGTKKTIISDDTWKLNVDGPIRTANEYDGEEYDATKELTGWNNTGYDDNKWLKPELVAAPAGKIVPQMNEQMKVMQTIKPIAINKISDQKYILDMGQNFSGWIKMNVQGKRGDAVKLRFAESLQKNGELYVANLRDAKVTDVYTLKGEGTETWQPSFVYHGFRYVEINNYPGTPSLENFEGQLVYDDLQTIGSFQTSNETINKIYKNAWWGIASNYKGMPVDCPQRNERQPWLGDRATGCYGESFLFANQNLYAKWLDDIEESQKPDGAIPDVAPAFWNYYSDNVTWPGTYILAAEMLYKQFGDKQSIIKHYASMKKWMDYMKTKYMKNNLITKDKYGDWCVPPESLELIHAKDSSLNTKGELLASAYYCRLLKIMQQFAVLSSNDKDVQTYAALYEDIKAAFNFKFYDATNGYYDNNSITSNLLPLYFGFVETKNQLKVANNILQKIKANNNHISTGVIGTQWLMRTLTGLGKADVAYTLASNKTYPSWGYMVENGATTIWELWNGNTADPKMNSQNHIMLLGDLLVWLNESIGGIKSDETDVAFKKVTMKPELVDGLSFAKASYHSLQGEIKSEWKREGNQFIWKIEVPANTTAKVCIPKSSPAMVMENGSPVLVNKLIKLIGKERDHSVFEIGSGSYLFTSTIK